MPIDNSAAENFVWSAARLVDRHRYALLFAEGPAQPVIDALRGYRNPDGGFGHGLEPDLRSPGSQPAPTLYALEILGRPLEGELCLVLALLPRYPVGLKNWSSIFADLLVVVRDRTSNMLGRVSRNLINRLEVFGARVPPHMTFSLSLI